MTRASVASTVYRNNAVVSPYPAQTVIRGRANVVSVRNGPASSIGSTTPEPMPAFHHELEGDSPRLDAEPMTLDPLVVGRPNRTGNHQPLSEISADPDNTRDRERDPFGTPPSSVSSVSGDAASYHSARSGERSSTAEAISRASSRQTASPNTIHEELPANEPVLPQTSESAERRLVASAAAAASSSHGDALTIPPNTYMRSSNYGSSSYGSSSTLPLAKRRSSVISPAASSSRKEASNLGAVIEDPVAAVIQEATSKASEEPTVGLGRVVQGPFGDDHEVR